VKIAVFWHIASIFRACHQLSWWILARLILWPWRWRRYVPPKRQLTFSRLHNVISQKIVLFITTAVRTSSPTTLLCFFHNDVFQHPVALSQVFFIWFHSVLLCNNFLFNLVPLFYSPLHVSASI
jgi:hypothetical protein